MNGPPGGAAVRVPRSGRSGSSGRSAALVAVGILCSRLAGLVRQRVFSHYFGLTAPADAFTAASRIPNVLNNLFGEGALSASFIPVYASLLARGEREEADRVAGAIASLLALVVAVTVLAGVIVTPWLLPFIAPGFSGATRELTARLVRILFPAVGLTVMSAWCLGVLNSHHRFFLSYAASVVWNAVMVATLLIFGSGADLPRLAEVLAWGSVAGSALMFAAQLPVVFRVAPHLRFAFTSTSDHVRTIARNFAPVFVSRGVVQMSGYIDTLLATLVSTGATTALANAQTLYLLPVSLFGMSVSAAELPSMSGIAHAGDAAIDKLRLRLDGGLRRIAFFVVPSAAAFLALGDVIAAALFQTGRFGHADAVYVWGILAGSAVGLLASTLGRLYSSTYYALRDTRTPLRFAVIRVLLTTVLGYLFAIPLPRWLGIAPSWGAAGLTASAGIAGWVEMLLLRSTLNNRIGPTGLAAGYVARLWVAAIGGAVAGWAVKLTLLPPNPILAAVAVLGAYGAVFLATTVALGIPEATTALGRAAAWGRRVR
ncbi:MAG TPA: murein biosynthesis integral membrane protein MurJ [Vicinamibacterales bacterium]|nr:murein biosynthesis integral membrane protein MurJ [Vicinamibacterales bacterium]